MHKWLHVTVAAMATALIFSAGAGAADLPKATQKVLANLKLDSSLLKGLDAELKVPQAWLDGAAKEKEVVILGTWSNRDFPKMTAPFKERYPFIKLRYHRTGTSGRGMKVLIALREGRVIADVTTSIADVFSLFKKNKALADLRELPGFTNAAKNLRAVDGTWVAFKLSFRCMAYNTTKIKKSDLPQTWGDLLTNPIWRGGRIGLSNHPNAWMLALWGTKGEKWGENFTRQLFEVVKPQQRKEGMTATTALTVAGEFYANIPAPEWRAKNYVKKGAPLGYHCPTPIPLSLSQIVILEKSPHKNGARLFANWMLSREGQLLQYAKSSVVPVHKALQSKRFLAFADTIVGKEQVIRDDALLGGAMQKKMLKMWKSQWTSPVGKGRKRGKKGKKKKKQ
jgi:ABC-type Fe3+ transport system substrate-binding protein